MLPLRRSGIRRRHQGRPVGVAAPGEPKDFLLQRAKDIGIKYEPDEFRLSFGTCTASKAIRSAPPCSRWARC